MLLSTLVLMLPYSILLIFMDSVSDSSSSSSSALRLSSCEDPFRICFTILESDSDSLPSESLSSILTSLSFAVFACCSDFGGCSDVAEEDDDFDDDDTSVEALDGCSDPSPSAAPGFFRRRGEEYAGRSTDFHS
jgi:hypothetical protein